MTDIKTTTTTTKEEEINNYKAYSSVGDNYRKFRQGYPDDIYDIIQEHTDSSRNLAIDVGCGNGQNTVRLAEYFDKVIGFDPAEGQIKNSIPHEKVEYRTCQAEKIDLPEESVDLITVATAAHWFNLPEFFNLTQKLLRSNGTLILWTYGFQEIIQNDEAKQIQSNLYYNTLRDYWAENVKLVLNEYKDIVPPFKNTIRMKKTYIKETPLDQFVGYYGTISSYGNYLLAGNPDILPDIKNQMMKAYNTTDDKTIIKSKYELCIIVSRKD
eukprot:gene4921-6135_t